MIQKLKYADCTKGGLHCGEVMNFACIERKCRETRNSIGCSVCMEQDHMTCRKSPLKYLCKQLAELVNSQKNSASREQGSASKEASAASNGESKYEEQQQNLLNLVVSSRHSILESVMQSTNLLIERMQHVKRLCIGLFDNIEKQARAKITRENEMESLVEKIIFSTNSLDSLQTLLHQIFDIIPEESFYHISGSPSMNVHNPAAPNASSDIKDINSGGGGGGGGGNSSNTSSFNSGNSGTILAEKTKPSVTSSNTSSQSQNSLVENSCSDLRNLHDNLSSLFTQINSTISQKSDLILAQLNLEEKYLSDLFTDQQLIHNLSGRKKLDLNFSLTDKHASITIAKPNLVKSNSGSSSNYKFALTNSNLPMNVPTKFAFKMKSINSQNWIAIGVALKKVRSAIAKHFHFLVFSYFLPSPPIKVIKGKSYSFSLSLGHGAYMISSNSGSWSHSESANNNVVKSFDFSNNSIVECIFDPIEGFIHFGLKDSPSKKYKLQIDKQKSEDDFYHPCVLFYYPNDEVELIYPYS